MEEDKYIYLVFSHSGTIVSKAIKFATKQRYSHVSISVNPKLDILYSFARRKIHNPFNAGFVSEDFDKGIFARLPNIKCKIYKVKVDDIKYNNVCDIIQNFNENKEKYDYNILGLFSPLTGVPFARENHYFCSQFVAEVLKESDILELDKFPLLYSPYDLLKKVEHENNKGNIDVEVFYEGELQRFNKLRKEENMLFSNNKSLYFEK